jgi:RNA methyltransferase, TrmH family
MKSLPKNLLGAYTKLTQKKYRLIEQKFIVEGVHLVEEALRSDWSIEAVIVSERGLVKEIGALERLKISHSVDWYECPGKDFTKLTDTVTSQGIVAIVRQKEYSAEEFWKQFPARSLLVAMDDVADPGNVGTILRTCDWFGVEGVLLSNDSVELFNAKVLRSTMGAVFHLPVFQDAQLSSMLEYARSIGFSIIATVVENGMPLDQYTFPSKSILVLGNEARGISPLVQQLADQFITIPKFGKAESLNVGIACGILLHAARIQ